MLNPDSFMSELKSLSESFNKGEESSHWKVYTIFGNVLENLQEPEPGVYLNTGLNFGNMLRDLYGRETVEWAKAHPELAGDCSHIDKYLEIDEFGMDEEIILYDRLKAIADRPLDDPERAALRERLTGSYFSRYIVCDTLEQAKDYWKEAINMPDRYFVISLTPIFRNPENAGKGGGWRWHKWGPYIGTFEARYEYLDDEEGIDQVLIGHLYEVREIPLSTKHCCRAHLSCNNSDSCECTCRTCKNAKELK